VREEGREAIEHAVGGFAYGEHPEIGKMAEVVAAIGAAESIARHGDAAVDGGAGIDRCENAQEDSAGEVFAVHGGRFGSIGAESDRGSEGNRVSPGSQIPLRISEFFFATPTP
jgi:hypothetical protein